MIFEEKPEGAAKEMFDHLYTTDFDPARLRAELETGKYDAEAVNRAAIDYVNEAALNFDHYEITWDDCYPGETIPGDASSHMAEAIGVLLDFGLDPNKIFTEESTNGHVEEYNIMHELQLVFNGHQAADSLYLLLAHGGDPNLPVDRWEISTEIDADMEFDTVNREDMVADCMYEAKLHYWLVLSGYRAAAGERPPLNPVNGFDLAKLKEHRFYYAGAIESDKSDQGWELCIFDRRTNWEVARF